MKRNAVNARQVQIRTVFQHFARSGSIGGIILFFCAIFAVIVANIPSLSHLENIWNVEMGVEIGNFSLKMTFLKWINDGFMATFFFLVGLEIKRELLVGELAQPKKAMLPIFAALGGMIFPALIFTIFNGGTPAAHGWGIPMATDIAFAMGVLAILGKSCPTSLKVFLTALAIVDDLGSIIVLAIFYPTHDIQGIFLLYAGIITLILFLFNRLQIRNPLLYIVPGLFLWYFVLQSGIHATIAGVIIAATIPANTRINEVRFYTTVQYYLNKFKASSSGQVNVFSSPEQLSILHIINNRVDDINPLLNRFQVALHGPVNFIVMPLFALANAGVAFSGDTFASGNISIAIGIFFGLLLGKPIGIFLFSWLSVKLKIAKMPSNASYKQLFAIGIVGGIGFTMSLFIDNLAFTNPEMIDMGKVAILITSMIAVVIGFIAVKITANKAE